MTIASSRSAEAFDSSPISLSNRNDVAMLVDAGPLLDGKLSPASAGAKRGMGCRRRVPEAQIPGVPFSAASALIGPGELRLDHQLRARLLLAIAAASLSLSGDQTVSEIARLGICTVGSA
jgi:hypothetical protein